MKFTSREELEAKLIAEIPGFNDETIYSLRNINNFRYFRTARDHMKVGRCPFCQIDQELNKVLFENDSWMIWENPVKKKNNGLAFHFVIPYKPTHITDPFLLNTNDWMRFAEVWYWVMSNYNLNGGALMSRFGLPTLNAGTIRHFHHNILVPDGTKEHRPPLTKKPEDFVNEDGPRLLVFEEMYQGTPFESLSDEKKKLVEKNL